MPNTKKTMRRSAAQVRGCRLLKNLTSQEEEQPPSSFIAERRTSQRGAARQIPDATPSHGYETRLL